MSVEAAREIITRLDLQMGERSLGNPYFRDPDVTAFLFKKESFFPIRQSKSDRKMAFVDGGNLELVGAPNFSVQLNRIYACVWQNNERKSILEIPEIEFFSAIYSIVKNGDLCFETILVPTKPEYAALLPDASEFVMKYVERLTEDVTQVGSTTKLASVVRSAAEWKFAEKVAESLDRDDTIVLDGSLQVFQRGWKYFLNLEKTTKERGILLTSLSKTSALFTDTGSSVLGALSQFAELNGIEGEWWHPIFESHKHHVFCVAVKLKSFSDWIFRLDFQLDQFKQLDEEKLSSILNLFCANSSDPTFPGYPYGLVDADLSSRVSRNEIDYYRALISSQIAGLNKEGRFVPHIRAGDAHNLLNTIAGF
jgi:hypothetical protein